MSPIEASPERTLLLNEDLGALRSCIDSLPAEYRTVIVMRELEEFSYVASHDLQEPIRKIRIWTNKIEETEEISEGVKDALARIEKSCVRMQKLIQGILQYSQADMQQVPMERADLNVVLDEVLSDYSDQLEEKGFIIEREKLPVLKVARLQFVQLFSGSVKLSKLPFKALKALKL